MNKNFSQTISFRSDDPAPIIELIRQYDVDPDVSASDEAERNNQRPETQASSAKLFEHFIGEPAWNHYDELYRTDF